MHAGLDAALNLVDDRDHLLTSFLKSVQIKREREKHSEK